jgi:regulator of replication initiation timing
MLKQWIRKLIGTNDIYEQVNDLQRYITGLRGEIGALKSLKTEVGIHNRALSRVIAKLDPMFAEDEMSPARKAESDKITEMVMRKLIGEHLASRVPGDD